MAQPDAFAWIGAVGGLVGALAGGYGAVVGYRSVRRVEQYKALDLRVELRKQEATVKSDFEALPALMERARRSRMAVLAQAGMTQSSVQRDWQAGFERDVASRDGLAAEIGALGGDVSTLAHNELERRTVRVHELQRLVDDLAGNYRESLAEDGRRRDRLAQTQHPRP